MIKGKAIATGFDVSLNNLYRRINPALPEIIEGQEYETVEAPYAYFKYKKQIWPVYDDDAGQCDYIYVNGEAFSAGSFASYPYNVEEFCYIIDKHTRETK